MSSDTSSLLPRRPAHTELLLRDARSGRDAAWGEIYERYRTMMLVTIGSRMPGFLRRRFDAEDILQDAFSKAYVGLESFEYRGEGSFRRWLRQIVFHEFRNLLRSQQAERSSVEYDTRALEKAHRAEGRGDAPSQLPSELESRELLLQRMAELPEEEHELITMRIFEQKSWEEIGEVLGCSRILASQRFDRTIARLAHALDGSPTGPDVGR